MGHGFRFPTTDILSYLCCGSSTKPIFQFKITDNLFGLHSALISFPYFLLLLGVVVGAFFIFLQVYYKYHHLAITNNIISDINPIIML